MELRIRKTTYSDLEAIIACERRYSEFVGQWDKEEHSTVLEEPNIYHGIIYTDQEPFIGYMILRGLISDSNNIELIRLALERPGDGNGKKVLNLIKDFCFETLQAKRLWLDVRDNNIRAQKAYERAGFITERKIENAVCVDGVYYTLYIMSVNQ